MKNEKGKMKKGPDGCRLAPFFISPFSCFLSRSVTLIEVVISTVIVAVMLTSALQAVGAARLGLRKLNDRSVGMLLAQDLMAEILQQAYADSAYGPSSGIGPGSDEVVTGNRSLYDDVDDYHGWQASPPQYKNGTPIAWATGYQRAVTVVWVDPANPSATVGSPSGAKLITVTVRKDGLDVATLVAIRTTAWVSPATALGATP